MGFFGFGKKKENAQKKSTCNCRCNCSSSTDDTKIVGKKFTENGIQSIKVLGTGCASCHALLKNTQNAITNMGLSVNVEYITDLQKIMAYGVMSMPALVVNEQVLSMGKVLKPSEIETLLSKTNA